MDLETRFWSYVEKTDNCWLWKRSVNKDGYGNFSCKGTVVKAHRFSYLLNHEIKDGLQLDHLCRNRSCVKPEHLEPVTQAENLKRGIYWQTLKTHCKHGHPFSVENTYITKQGWRMCKTCGRIRYQRQQSSRL